MKRQGCICNVELHYGKFQGLPFSFYALGLKDHAITGPAAASEASLEQWLRIGTTLVKRHKSADLNAVCRRIGNRPLIAPRGIQPQVVEGYVDVYGDRIADASFVCLRTTLNTVLVLRSGWND